MKCVTEQDTASALELTVIKRRRVIASQAPNCDEACIYRTKEREIMSPVSSLLYSSSYSSTCSSSR